MPLAGDGFEHLATQGTFAVAGLGGYDCQATFLKPAVDCVDTFNPGCDAGDLLAAFRHSLRILQNLHDQFLDGLILQFRAAIIVYSLTDELLAVLQGVHSGFVVDALKRL